MWFSFSFRMQAARKKKENLFMAKNGVSTKIGTAEEAEECGRRRRRRRRETGSRAFLFPSPVLLCANTCVWPAPPAYVPARVDAGWRYIQHVLFAGGMVFRGVKGDHTWARSSTLPAKNVEFRALW